MSVIDPSSDDLLSGIRDFIKEILSDPALKDLDDLSNDVINFGDLKVVDVEFHRSLGKISWGVRVTIDEADPDSIGLQNLVVSRLLGKYPSIEFEVRTEW